MTIVHFPYLCALISILFPSQLMSNSIILTGDSLSIAEVIAVSRHNQFVDISPNAWQRVEAAYNMVQEQVANKKVVYGITTGFGNNANKVMTDAAEAKALQRNLVISHAVGIGEPLSVELVRAMMLIRLNTNLAGHSGIAVETLKLLTAMLNAQIHPFVPSQGSVGASGDLCPLAHIACALIGVGNVFVKSADGKTWELKPAAAALQAAGLSPVELSYKEGLSLINGTTLMAALGCFAIHDAEKTLHQAEASAALMFEALCARREAFDDRIHAVRRHTQQRAVAARFREQLEGSSYFGIAIPADKTVNVAEDTPSWVSAQSFERFKAQKQIPQDAYSVRCSPQILGATWQAVEHVRGVIETELNAVVDNPILFPETGEALSGGNFHGQPLAIALDYLKIAIAELGNLLERQIAKFVDAATNDALPPFLCANAGLHSGMMITQYAAAAVVSENKVLVHPASADSIPTSANQEDHVSMGPIAGRQALEILGNVRKILAIHLLNAAQAMDLRRQQFEAWQLPTVQSATTLAFYNKIRERVPYLLEDRFLQPDIEALLLLLNDL